MGLHFAARSVIGRLVVLALVSVPVWAQGGASLRSIVIPKPDLERYVQDEAALVVLGKALFWDVQLSSDNRVACATCHFHAGADHRRQQQLATVKDPVPQNHLLASHDFPIAYDAMAAGRRVGSSGVASPHGLDVRQVTRRNAPSVVNSVYVFRNFWDGRASDIFTGRTPLGEADTSAHVLVDDSGQLSAVRVRIEKAVLASQAMGPPLDTIEMSYPGRSWPMLGRKMITAHPLALQKVATDDSVLGAFVGNAARGLAGEHSYEALIRRAFRPEYWRSTVRVDESGVVLAAAEATGGFTQQEHNFPLFFGLAIQAYESTLISDESPYDRYLDGKKDALTDVELTGLEMFQRRACASCHIDPELSLSTYSGVFGYGPYRGLGPEAGFVSTGVEPSQNDAGLRLGAFKTPSLRNVEFTGPYFHTGSKSTLEQIIDFYTAGGDYFTGNLRRWGPDSRERVAMPALMKAFSDDRVRFERAPFDHPELCVPVGRVETGDERLARIPAVGGKGNVVPLQTFEELLLGVGGDGSRAHTLVESCSN